jgi:hypothetical protein
MIRLHMIVEGQTEEGFVRSVLINHLGNFDVSTDVRRAETGRHRKKVFAAALPPTER